MQEGRIRWQFPSIVCFCELTWAFIRAKFPQSHKGMLTHLLTLANPVSQTTGTSSCLSDFCWLFCSLQLTGLFSSANWSVLSTSLDCNLLLTLGPSFPRPLLVLWEISRASPLCGFRSKTKGPSDWHPHPQKRMPPIVSQCSKLSITVLWSYRLSSFSKLNMEYIYIYSFGSYTCQLYWSFYFLHFLIWLCVL